ncbi:hypothetical protein [Actinophytocola sp.]|uniref:hypothetical protein n=1 Tax=Actinophytocola sp. TaxID=1872138 RepID=UPI003D6BBE89
MPELPFPIEFTLPAGWKAVDPAGAGAPDVAFVAVRPGSDEGLTANITLAGEYRTDDVSLEQLAEDSVERLRADGADVTVTRLADFGTEYVPGLAQMLFLVTDLAGARRRLVQSQVYLAMVDRAGSGKRAVLRLALTATKTQLPAAEPEFREFVGSIRPTERALSAETLRAAAAAPDAPAELAALATAVREGRTSWAAIAEGKAGDLPEVRALRDATAQRARGLAAEWRGRD